MSTLVEQVRRDAEILRRYRAGASIYAIRHEMNAGAEHIYRVIKDEPRHEPPVKKKPEPPRGHGRIASGITIGRPLLNIEERRLAVDDCKWALYRAASITEGAAAIGVTVDALLDWQERDRAWCEASGLCPRCETLTRGQPCDCVDDHINWDRLDVDMVIEMVGAERLRELFDNSPVMALCQDIQRGRVDGSLPSVV